MELEFHELLTIKIFQIFFIVLEFIELEYHGKLDFHKIKFQKSGRLLNISQIVVHPYIFSQIVVYGQFGPLFTEEIYLESQLISYGDQSFTNGDLGVETLTIGSTTSHQVTIPKIVFGCGHNNDVTFIEAGSSIIGLGGGHLSLVSQLNKYIGGKFSYCLVPAENSNVTGKINFGSNGLVSGNGVVSSFNHPSL